MMQPFSQSEESNMIELPEVHKNAIVVAAHTDIIASDSYYWRIKGEKGVLEKRHLPLLRAGGITVIGEHVGGDAPYGYNPATLPYTTPLHRAMRNIDYAYMEAEESDSIVVATSVQDIHRAKKEDKIAIVLCFEGASPLEDEISFLHNFYRLGLRCLGLSHNLRNSLADGLMERSQGGLTCFGVDVVKACNELGILVDVSHLCDKACWDVLEVTSQPITASHSNARAVHPHPRNLTDDQIKAIAQAGGVIGVHTLNMLVGGSEEPTIDDLMKHIVHMVQVGGIDCVGIGPDMMENWQHEYFRLATEEAPKYTSIPTTSMNYAYPKGISSLAETPNITQGLFELGFDREEITKILGGNFMRLFAQVWGD
jgi:membrane dipeptidase